MSEYEMQRSIFAEIAYRANQDARWKRIAAVPNGQYRPGQRAEPGINAGFPDIILPIACRGYKGMVMELKIGKNKTSAAQTDWLLWFKENGWRICVVWDDPAAAILEFEWYLGEAQ